MMNGLSGYSDNDSGSHKKKRKRVSLTCTSCKQRKVKCDQGKPCSSCVKKRIPSHLCIYEDSPFIPSTSQSTNPAETVVLLKDENAKLKAELEELKKWKEIVTSDPVPESLSGQVRLYENVTFKANKLVYFGPTSWRTLIDKEGAYSELVQSAKKYVSTVKKEWKIERNLKHISHEEYKDINVETPQRLLENLAKYLPDYDTIRNHLENYTKGYWHKRLPIIEPDQFLKDFHQIVIKEGDGLSFKIQSKTIDFSRIALILVVLKYMTITSNSYLKDSQYDVRDHLLRYAEKLLELSKSTVKGTIPALQALILKRQFRMINPVDGDGGDASGGALAFKTAINMGILMGLNKNIDVLYKKTPVSSRNVYKNIWKYLMYQDSVLSLHLGIPLSIDDQFVDASYLKQGNLFDVLTGFYREAVKVLTKSESCHQHEIVAIIDKMENYNDGEFLKLSYAVKNLGAASSVLNDPNKLLSIEYKLFGIYALHVLYDVLYHGVEDDDPNKDVYYNGTMKYGTLTATHFIEILLRFNKFCVDNKDNAEDLFHIVEMAQSIVGVSKIIFIKIFCAICTFEVIRLFEDDLRSTHPKKLHFSMDISDFELLNPRDSSNSLNASFRSPAFLHGLMTLACKYMLKMKNQSFESVFNLNFCLFVVLALFKYFEKFIDRKLSKEKETSSLNKIETTVNYDDNLPCRSDSPSKTSNAHHPIPSDNNPHPINVSSVYTPNSVSGSIVSSLPETRSPNSTTNSTIPTQSYMTGDFATNLTDPIDEMFKDVLKDDNLFSMQFDATYNWEVSNFLSTGSGMFYDNRDNFYFQPNQPPSDNHNNQSHNSHNQQP